MATLFELTAQLQELREMVLSGEYDPEVLKDTMEGVEGEFKQKADGYARVMKECQYSVDALETESKRLKERAESIKKNIQKMRDTLQNEMIKTGNEKFKTDFFSFSVKNNPPSVFVDDESIIPNEFLIPQPAKVDKKSILEKLKAGETVDGCSLYLGQSLRIK